MAPDHAVPVTNGGVRILLLPYLALKEVLGQMELMNLVELSFVSKKTKSIVRLCNLKVKSISLKRDGVNLSFNSKGIHFTSVDESKLEDKKETRMIGKYRLDSWSKSTETKYNRIKCITNIKDVLAIFNYCKEVFFFPANCTYFMLNQSKELVRTVMEEGPNVIDHLVCGNANDKDQYILNYILDRCQLALLHSSNLIIVN